jgi:hypothetical protein
LSARMAATTSHAGCRGLSRVLGKVMACTHNTVLPLALVAIENDTLKLTCFIVLACTNY